MVLFVGLRDGVEFIICKDNVTTDFKVPPFVNAPVTICDDFDIEKVDAHHWRQLGSFACCKLRQFHVATRRLMNPFHWTDYKFHCVGRVPDKYGDQQYNYLGIWKPYFEYINFHNVFLLVRKYDRDACIILKAELKWTDQTIEKVLVRFSRAIGGQWVSDVMVSELAGFDSVVGQFMRLENVPWYKIEIYKFMIGDTCTMISGSNCYEMSQSLRTLFDIGMTEGKSVWHDTVDSGVSSAESLSFSTSAGPDTTSVKLCTNVDDPMSTKKRAASDRGSFSVNKKCHSDISVVVITK